MSRSSILEALTDEHKSLAAQIAELETQRDGIARAIEALQSAGGSAPAGRGRKKAAKKVARKRRTMTDEQRQAVSERMKKYWAARREQS